MVEDFPQGNEPHAQPRQEDRWIGEHRRDAGPAGLWRWQPEIRCAADEHDAATGRASTRDSTPAPTASTASTAATAPGVTPVTLGVTRVFPALTFSMPVGAVQAPGDASRWFIIEQAGKVRVFANQAGAASTSDFIDVTARVTCCGETGLLGLAFHPGFPADPRAYLSYTTAVGGQLVSRLTEYRSTDGGATLDPSTERVLLQINQPQKNHNGGHVVFGADGYLYFGLGEAAAPAIRTARSATDKTWIRCSARCCVSTSIRRPCPTASPRTTLTPLTRRAAIPQESTWMRGILPTSIQVLSVADRAVRISQALPPSPSPKYR